MSTEILKEIKNILLINKIEDIVPIKCTANQNDVCEICYTGYTSDSIRCDECHKSICISCMNQTLTRQIGISSDDKQDLDFIKKEKVVTICVAFRCPHCNINGEHIINRFSKEELLAVMHIDYTANHTECTKHYQHKKEMNLMKNQLQCIKRLNRYPNDIQIKDELILELQKHIDILVTESEDNKRYHLENLKIKNEKGSSLIDIYGERL